MAVLIEKGSRGERGSSGGLFVTFDNSRYF